MNDLKAINIIFDIIFPLMAENKYVELDRYIGDFDLENATNIEITSLLRSSYSVRDKLPSWHYALKKAHNLPYVKLQGLQFDDNIRLRATSIDGCVVTFHDGTTSDIFSYYVNAAAIDSWCDGNDIDRTDFTPQGREIRFLHREDAMLCYLKYS